MLSEARHRLLPEPYHALQVFERSERTVLPSITNDCRGLCRPDSGQPSELGFVGEVRIEPFSIRERNPRSLFAPNPFLYGDPEVGRRRRGEFRLGRWSPCGVSGSRSEAQTNAGACEHECCRGRERSRFNSIQGEHSVPESPGPGSTCCHPDRRPGADCGTWDISGSARLPCPCEARIDRRC